MILRTRAVLAALLVLAVWTPVRSVWAHGLIGHIHVTGWAIENLPPGELRSLFDDPDVFRAALTGAMFPDTGYPLNNPAAREYAEYAHWEPFIQRFIQHVRETYGPTYDTKEERMLVAFLLGAASHGLQDELFDSTFLYEVEERDGPSQEVTDPGTDGFLVLDGFFRLLPADYLPTEEVVPLFGVLNQPIDSALIASQVQVVRNIYVNDNVGLRVAANYGQRARAQIPWAAANYLDPGVPGCHGAEVEPTMRHIQALWERLNDRFDEASDLLVHQWPDAPRRLRSGDHTKVASWITFVLGKGIQEGSATTSLKDESGTAVPYHLRYTRWGGTSRIIRFQPDADLVAGATYTATLEPGAQMIDGSTTAEAHSVTFQVECEDPNDPACPPVVVEDDPQVVPGTPAATPTATRTATMTIAVATATPTPPPTAACAGDCDAGGSVTVDEVIRGINIMLGESSLDECRRLDASGDGAITVDELVTAVTHILLGC